MSVIKLDVLNSFKLKLQDADKDFDPIRDEFTRRNHIELIASENIVSELF